MKFKQIENYEEGRCFLKAMEVLGNDMSWEYKIYEEACNEFGGISLEDILSIFNRCYGTCHIFSHFDKYEFETLKQIDLTGKTGILLLINNLTQAHACAIIDGVVMDMVKPNSDSLVIGVLE